MKIPLGLFASVALLAACPAWSRTAFQIKCEDHMAKTLSVLSAKQSGYTLDTSVSYRTLTGMTRRGHPGNMVLGLTLMQSSTRVGFEGQILQDRTSGYECITPQIHVVLEYSPMKVYVGREFPAGSCAYHEILAHELRHVQAYQNFLPRVETIVRQALARRFQSSPLYAPSGRAKSLLSQEINTGWMPYIKNELAKVEQSQAQIDTPAEYARIGRACRGEVQAILHRHNS